MSGGIGTLNTAHWPHLVTLCFFSYRTYRLTDICS